MSALTHLIVLSGMAKEGAARRPLGCMGACLTRRACVCICPGLPEVFSAQAVRTPGNPAQVPDRA